MKIFITGGAGFIGSHTCKLLHQLGIETLVYDNLSTGFRENVKWSELIEGDIRDEILLTRTLQAFKPDGIIHFAASAYVGESVADPMKYFSNNVAGSITLLKSMESSDVRNLVFSSTCATYGNPIQIPISENHPQNPVNPYGLSKLIVEQILTSLAKHKKINFIGLRYFNAAGADISGELHEMHNPETHLIPLAINSAMSNYKLKVFGDDYETSDGTAVRDYIHVQDLAEAHLKALYALETENNLFLNIGTGRGYSVLEILDAMKRIGLNPNYEVSKRRHGDPAILVADSNRAKEMLTWEPRYSDIDTIIKSSIGHSSLK